MKVNQGIAAYVVSLLLSVGGCAAVWVAFGYAMARADSWGPPAERDYSSASGGFVAHVTPGRERYDESRKGWVQEKAARLEVFRVSKRTRTLEWACDLDNLGQSPVSWRVLDNAGNLFLTCSLRGDVHRFHLPADGVRLRAHSAPGKLAPSFGQ